MDFSETNKGIFNLDNQDGNNTVLLRSPEESLLPSMRDQVDNNSPRVSLKYYAKQKEKLFEYKERTAMARFKEK